MKRIAIWVITMSVLVAPVFGAAAAFGVDGGALQGGNGPVSTCDNSFTESYTTSRGNVVSVTIGDIATGCAGGRLSVTVTDSAGAAVASGGPVDVTAGTATVPLSPNPFATAVAGIHVLIEGP